LLHFRHTPHPSPSSSVAKSLLSKSVRRNSCFPIFKFEYSFSSRITTINRWLVEHGYDIVKLWADIDDVIIKVLISAHSVLKHNYRACFPHHYRGSACFEILGFDILLDRKLKPYVLEVRSRIDIK
jgi:tubulin polyglutamylase TTLL6/13